MLNDRFSKIFGNTPILGMLHLAGEDPVARALYELSIFEEEGIDGAIVENYHRGSVSDVVRVLEAIQRLKTRVVIGVNVLPNEFQDSFHLASKYSAKFIQLDHVAGTYLLRGTLDFNAYSEAKGKHPEVVVLGGVWPKYYEPTQGSDMKTDITEGMQRAEAVVVTGAGTGKTTPLQKIEYFRQVLGTHPLIVGAGLTPQNAYDQLRIADGAIVGSTFKPSHDASPSGDTELVVDRNRVREFMAVVREVRKYKEKLSHSN